MIPVHAQEQWHDSLAIYLDIASKNNPRLLLKYDEYKAALLKLPQVAALPDPEVNMEFFLKPMEIPGGKQIAEIQLMQMFPWFGTLKYAKDEMSLMAKAAYQALRDAKLQVCYQVQKNWYDLYKIRRNIALTEQNLKWLGSIEKLALVKYKTAGTTLTTQTAQPKPGLSPTNANTAMGEMEQMGRNTTGATPQASMSAMPANEMGNAPSGLSAVLRLQMEKAELENALAALHNSERTQRARFNALLDRDAEAPVFVPDSLSNDPNETLILSANGETPASQPMLEMLRYESEALDARAQMVKRMGYPMLGAGLGYSIIGKSDMSMSEMNGKDMFMPMVKFTLPVYRSKYKAMREETQTLKSASEKRFKETQHDIRTAYFEAVEQYYNNRRQIDLYRKQTGTLKKILHLSVREFSVSGNGLTDVLRTQQELYAYELKLEEALSNLNTSIALINRLTNNGQD